MSSNYPQNFIPIHWSVATLQFKISNTLRERLRRTKLKIIYFLFNAGMAAF